MIDDGSKVPLDAAALSDLGARVVRHDKPRGVGASRNAGLAVATGDVISFHDAHMRFPDAAELREVSKGKYTGALGCLEAAAEEALATDAVVSTYSRDVRKQRGFVGYGAELHYNRKDGLQPKYRIYKSEDEWHRVACPMGAGYFFSRTLADRLAAVTGELWDDTAGRWGFSEQALAVKAFLMDVPVLVSRDIFIRHLYRSQNPCPDAGKELAKNMVRSMSRILTPESFNLRFRPHALKRMTEKELDQILASDNVGARRAVPAVVAAHASSPEGLRPGGGGAPATWHARPQSDIFTHLCGKNATVVERHPDHAWLDQVVAAAQPVGARRAVPAVVGAHASSPEGLRPGGGGAPGSAPIRVLQWRPGEATAMLRDLLPEAEIYCIEMPGHRADNWWDICKAMNVKLTKCNLGDDYVNRPLKAGWGPFDIILIGGEMQDECRAVVGARRAVPLLAEGGTVLTNPSQDRFQIEDNERRKEDKQLKAFTVGARRAVPNRKPEIGNRQSSVTVLLLNWKRPENIGPILDSLVSQTVAPRVVVWNNGGDLLFIDGEKKKPIAEHEAVDLVVRSSGNLGCFPRWWLAGLAQTEFVCSMDDDLLLRDDRVLEDAVAACRELRPDGVVGFFGWNRVDGKPYKGAQHINGSSENRDVDLVKGRFMMLRRETLCRVPLTPPDGIGPEALFRADDIYLNLMISGGRPGYHLVPGVLGKRWRDLKQDGRALASQPGHYDQRGKVIDTLLKYLTTKGTKENNKGVEEKGMKDPSQLAPLRGGNRQ